MSRWTRPRFSARYLFWYTIGFSVVQGVYYSVVT
jgi:hypothetical protein